MSFQTLSCLAMAGLASASLLQSAPVQSFQPEKDVLPVRDSDSDSGGILLRLLMPAGTDTPVRVQVTVYGPKGAPLFSRRLSSGQMEIDGLAPPDYRLRVEVNGYEPAERMVRRSEFVGSTAFLTLALRPVRSADQPDGRVAPVVRADELRIPEKARHLLHKATQAGDRGKAEKALKLLDQALQIAPEFHQAHNNRGVILLRLSEHVQAETEFRRALELSPDDPMALKNLCWVLVAQRRYQEAVQYLQRLAGIRTEDAWAHSFLGESLFQLGRYRESEASFERALQLDPQSYVASYRLGALCYSRNDWDGALRHWKRFLKTNQGIDDPSIKKLVKELEQR